MPYEMQFSINLYNLMRSTLIIIDNRSQRFSPAVHLGQSWRKAQKKVIFLFFFRY